MQAAGDLSATATLSDERRALIRTTPKGRIAVPVRLLDERGQEPATFVVEWSWKHPSKASASI